MLFNRLVAVTAAVLTAQATAADYGFGILANSTDKLATVVAGAPAKPDHIQCSIRAGKTKVRGVNLGSWLVSEKWMTNSIKIWENVPKEHEEGGEYPAMKYGPNPEQRRKNFEEHHKKFIDESHIKAIAAAGLNTVRVPIGHWILGEDPTDLSKKEDWKVYPDGGAKYLDLLIKEWAMTHNIAVLVSIHGAKGSQSGADHSAPHQPGVINWSTYPENVANTLKVAEWLASRYKDEPAFLGIGLLNEPTSNDKTGVDEKVMNKYYQDAYALVRKSSADCVLTIMPLLWKQEPDNLNGFMEAPDYINVWVEWHPYFIWGFAELSPDDLLNAISVKFQDKLNKWNTRPNANKMFFGEWSLASTGQFRNPDDDAFIRWTTAQMAVMNQAGAGWTYWSWRVDGDDAPPPSFNAWSMGNVLAKPKLAEIINAK